MFFSFFFFLVFLIESPFILKNNIKKKFIGDCETLVSKDLSWTSALHNTNI